MLAADRSSFYSESKTSQTKYSDNEKQMHWYIVCLCALRVY